MDPKSQEKFEEILAKEVSSLVDTEIAFLKARRSYLTKKQQEDYAEILEPKEEVKKVVKKK